MPASSSDLLETIERWRCVEGWRFWFALLALAVLLAAAAQLTYSTGGTRYAYLHAMYVPVALAGCLFRAPGGLLTGLLAGLLVGPLMPLDVATQAPQATGAWLYRMGFFMLLGGLIGQLSHLVNLRLDQLQAAMDNLAHAYARTLKGFTTLVAYRDEDTAGHCDRVAQNARVIGQQMRLPDDDLDNLYWAGILHDLGKVATPTEILLKRGPLTADEFREVQKHVVVGAQLLTDVAGEFQPIAAGVRSHHERWDGSGYPDGLAGEEIPLFGRILAVVDVFEALTSKRPYRGPLEAEQALSYIRDESGLHFDPRLVDLLMRSYREGLIGVNAGGEPADEYAEALPRVRAFAPGAKAG